MNSNARKEEQFDEFYDLINSRKDRYNYINHDKKTLDELQQDYDEFYKNAYKQTDEDLINKYRVGNKTVTKRRLNIFRLFLVVFGAVSLIAVLLLVAIGIKSAFSNFSKDKHITINSSSKDNPERQFQFEVLEGWKEVDNKPNEDASIIVFGPNDKAFMVICEDKSEIGNTVLLEEYCDALQDLKKIETDGTKKQSIITLKGYQAVEFKADIINEDNTYRYLITVIETQDSFYQLVAWTTAENYENTEAEFLKMVNSFYQID